MRLRGCFWSFGVIFLIQVQAFAHESDLLFETLSARAREARKSKFTYRVPIELQIYDTNPFQQVINKDLNDLEDPSYKFLNRDAKKEWALRVSLNLIEIACLTGNFKWIKSLSTQMTPDEILERSNLEILYRYEGQEVYVSTGLQFDYLNSLEFCLQYDTKIFDEKNNSAVEQLAPLKFAKKAQKLFFNENVSEANRFGNQKVSFRYKMVSKILDRLESEKNLNLPDPANLPSSFRIRYNGATDGDVRNAFEIHDYRYYGVYPLFLAFQQGDAHAALRLLMRSEFRSQIKWFARYFDHGEIYFMAPSEVAAKEGKIRSLYALFYYAYLHHDFRRGASREERWSFRPLWNRLKKSEGELDSEIGWVDRLETTLMEDVETERIRPIHPKEETGFSQFKHRSELNWAILNRNIATTLFLQRRFLEFKNPINRDRTEAETLIYRLAYDEVFQGLIDYFLRHSDDELSKSESWRIAEGQDFGRHSESEVWATPKVSWQFVLEVMEEMNSTLEKILEKEVKMIEGSPDEIKYSDSELKRHIISRDLLILKQLKLKYGQAWDPSKYNRQDFNGILNTLKTITSRYLSLFKEDLIFEVMNAKRFNEPSSDSEVKRVGRLNYLFKLGILFQTFLQPYIRTQDTDQKLIENSLVLPWILFKYSNFISNFQDSPAIKATKILIRWFDQKIAEGKSIPYASFYVATQLIHHFSELAEYPYLRKDFSTPSFEAAFQRYIDFESDSPDVWMDQFEFSKYQVFAPEQLNEVRHRLQIAVQKSNGRDDVLSRNISQIADQEGMQQFRTWSEKIAWSRSVLSSHTLFKQFGMLIRKRPDLAQLEGAKSVPVAEVLKLNSNHDPDPVLRLPAIDEIENELAFKEDPAFTFLMLKHLIRTQNLSEGSNPRFWISTE